MARYALWPFRPAAPPLHDPHHDPRHDPTGHRLSALSTRLREARAADQHAPLFALEHELRAALHEVRFSSPDYRPVSLSAALVRTAETLRAVGIELEVAAALATASGWGAGAPDWSPQVCDALGWVLRECTANILRHSTAHRAWITLTPTADGLRLAVGNNGVPRERQGGRAEGSGPETGSGIPSMLAQVSVMGGTLRVDRTDTRFELVAIVPTGPRPGVRAAVGSA